jgi:hypothetical protein
MSDALKHAAGVARVMKDFAKADGLADRIPIEAERKNAEMLNLLAQRKAKEVVSRFGNEDLAKWPFWAAGEGYASRGRAYAAVGDNAKAEADLKAAFERIGDPRARNEVQEVLESISGHQ